MAETSILFDGYDRRLSLEFNEPKLKPGAQALLPSHEPPGAGFVRRDRSPDRVPVVNVWVLALYREVYLCRLTHCRMHGGAQVDD